MFTRGLFTALGFVALYHYGLVKQVLWFEAAACGAGWELFVRKKWYVKQEPVEGGKAEEIYKGPFDLIQFYQSFFLAAIDGRFCTDP